MLYLQHLTDVNPAAFARRLRAIDRCCACRAALRSGRGGKTRSYKGLYHVLHGSLSPIRGVRPSDLRLDNLLPRLKPENNDGVETREVILATNPNMKAKRPQITSAVYEAAWSAGDATAMGMPVGKRSRIRRRSNDGQSLTNRHEM